MNKSNTLDQRFIILTAPSGAGKTTIAHELLRQMPELSFSISVTTRPPRNGEIEGRDYYFINLDEFKEKIAEGAFVEHEKVYKGKYYGTLHAELDRIWQDHKFPLRVVDVKGAEALKKHFGDKAVSIFIKPPSLEVLKQRLTNRGSDDPGNIEERVTSALKEMEYENNFDYIVENKELKTAITEIAAIIKSFIYSK